MTIYSKTIYKEKDITIIWGYLQFLRLEWQESEIFELIKFHFNLNKNI